MRAGSVLTLALALLGLARARAHAAPEDEPTLLRLAPTPHTLARAHGDALAGTLTKRLQREPDTARGEVSVCAPASTEAPLDGPAPRPLVTVFLPLRSASDGGPTDGEIAARLRTVVPSLTLKDLRVRRLAIPTAPPTPAPNAPRTDGAIPRGVLAMSLSANALLAALLLWRRPRARKVDRHDRVVPPP